MTWDLRRISLAYESAVLRAALPCLLILSISCAAGAQDVQVSLEKSEVYVGEPFGVRVKVSGDEVPEPPVFPESDDFSIEYEGESRDNRSSVVIVNGRIVKNEEKGHLFSYRFTALRPGKLLIPVAAVRLGGHTLHTNLNFVTAVKPGESEDFKLRVEISEAEVYVGQPVTLVVTWYLAKDVQGFQFNLPFLSDRRFEVTDLDERIDPAQRDQYLQIDAGTGPVVARKMRVVYGGREFTALRFRKALIPRTAGRLALGQSSVAFNALAGYQKRGAGLFDSFDDFFEGDFPFGIGRQAVYKKMVAPSNEPVLTVKELPVEGRPVNFSGLVGKYRVAATALPTEARVGDPITLTVQVAGPDYLDNVKLPRLDRQQSLIRDFKVPSEMAAGKVSGGVITFTQTIRAKSAEVKEVPPIELPYFDAGRGRYEITRTKPVPLKIEAARVVTALDAEGREVAEIPSSELETWTKGIAHNYEDESVLAREGKPALGFSARTWLMLLCLPPLFYLLLWSGTIFIRRRLADPAALRARGAYREFNAALGSLERITGAAFFSGLLRALREYLGAKFRRPGGGLTYAEVESAVEGRSLPAEVKDRVKMLFELCEQGSYGGGTGYEQKWEALVKEARHLVRELERRL